jgi:hypothetical protein
MRIITTSELRNWEDYIPGKYDHRVNMCWLIDHSLFQWRSWFMVWSKGYNDGTRKQIERVSTAWEWRVAVTGQVSSFLNGDRQMADDEDWSRLLQDHPIFSNKNKSLEFSTLSLRGSDNVDSSDTGSSSFGRRQTMILKDADLIVAADKEIRMSSFGDIKLSRSTRKSYKVCRSTVFLSPENSRSVWGTAYAKPTVWNTSNIPQSKRETTRSCWNASSCSRCPTSCRI